ncbi:DUF3426 domain-containing protein [Hydrogenophaga sp.]|uniref:DUF3426 domain-containing protein n=1 Tax=Hydrogenophaga sp. TaxID=1904254 RepID=UPI0025BA7E95|nr:DUF3426 domain-containing protein [Hydrogenophaga sp.]
MDASAMPSAEPVAEIAPTVPLAPAEAEVPADDDLRAWFGDGPLEPPAPADVEEVPAEEVAPLAAEPTEQADIAPEPSADPPPADMPDAAPLTENEQASPASDSDGLSPEFQAELQRFVQSAREVPMAAPGLVRPDVVEKVASEAAQSSTSSDDDTDDATVVPGFVQQAQRQAFWTSGAMRGLLSLVVLLLGLVLLGQWGIQHRHTLVAEHPEWRPWVVQACGYLGCDLSPAHRINAVEIESAQLVRRLGNFYSFDFVLRNRAPVEVAPPALELTLTNTTDQPVLRRVFLPSDWPDAPLALPAQGTVSVSLRLAIALDEGAPTAGYRALVFYP